MKVIVTGITGMIGSETIRAAIADKAITELVLLGRKKSELRHPKIVSIIHKDFSNYNGLEKAFENADALIWCLGISQMQVSRQQYELITFDYTKACVDFCLMHNPHIRFVFVSGDGADPTEKSRTIFKRMKGKAENYLLRSGLKEVIIARPAAVRPKRKNRNAPFAYRLLYPLFPLLEKMAPHKIIWSDKLGKALLVLAKEGADEKIVENLELRVLGNE